MSSFGRRVSLVPALFLAALMASPARAQVVTPDVSAETKIMADLLATPGMKKAFDYIERMQQKPDDILQEWIGLCEAYAPEGDEIYRANYIYRIFRTYGLENVYIDDEKNVIGIRPGTGGGPKLVLSAHFDTVNLWPKEQPIHAYLADDRIWCPGASDDLVGIMQMFTIMRALNAANVQTKGDLWFVGFTGEERGSRGRATPCCSSTAAAAKASRRAAIRSTTRRSCASSRRSSATIRRSIGSIAAGCRMRSTRWRR
jgi:tripeptide aminopeptidase